MGSLAPLWSIEFLRVLWSSLEFILYFLILPGNQWFLLYRVTHMYWYCKTRPFRGQNVLWQKKYFFSQILLRFISPIRYKTVFFYHQLFTSKKPLVSKTLKFIGHTSSKYPVVNKNYLYHFMILKFHKISNCSKTSLVRSKIFSEHLRMIISQNPCDFK